MDTDQMNYQDIIDEARTLAQHLHEWSEQFDKCDAESELSWGAVTHIKRAISNLQGAKQENALAQKAEREALLKRIETGTTTSRDATVARRLMS